LFLARFDFILTILSFKQIHLAAGLFFSAIRFFYRVFARFFQIVSPLFCAPWGKIFKANLPNALFPAGFCVILYTSTVYSFFRGGIPDEKYFSQTDFT
jgi:hypothetical protein